MSEHAQGRTLEHLPYIAPRNLDLIQHELDNGDGAVIHRTSDMTRPYSLEVVAHSTSMNAEARLCLSSSFVFAGSTDHSEVRRIQDCYLETIRGFGLGALGITPTFVNGDKKSMKLAFDDAKTSVTTWYKPGDGKPYTIYVANDKRDGQNNKVTSTAPVYNPENLDQAIASYMKLVSIVDYALSGIALPKYIVDYVEHRTVSRRQNQKHRKASSEKDAKIELTKAEQEAAALDDRYRPTVPNPNARLDQVHGIDQDSQAKIGDRLLAFRNPELARLWQVDSSDGIIIYGDRGTGKTMLATALANELGARLWQINPSDLVDSYVGKSALKTREMLQNVCKVSKLGPVVLLFDEIDGVVTNNEDQNTERDAVLTEIKTGLANIAANYPNVLPIATTNHMERVDGTLRRPGRFGLSIYMERPDDNARRQILLDHINLDEIDDQRIFETMEPEEFEKLVHSTRGLTGVEIAEVIANCRRQKFAQHVKFGNFPGSITLDDILQEVSVYMGQSHEF